MLGAAIFTFFTAASLPLGLVIGFIAFSVLAGAGIAGELLFGDRDEKR
jgi:hypothetical protein